MPLYKPPKQALPWLAPGQQPNVRLKINWEHPLTEDLIYCAVKGVNLVDEAPFEITSGNSNIRQWVGGKEVFKSDSDSLGQVIGAAPTILDLDGVVDFTIVAKNFNPSSSGNFGKMLTCPVSLTTWNSPFTYFDIGRDFNKRSPTSGNSKSF